MNGEEEGQLREAVQNMQGGTATLAPTIPVPESFGGKTGCEGRVYVFDLAGQ